MWKLFNKAYARVAGSKTLQIVLGGKTTLHKFSRFSLLKQNKKKTKKKEKKKQNSFPRINYAFYHLTEEKKKKLEKNESEKKKQQSLFF